MIEQFDQNLVELFGKRVIAIDDGLVVSGGLAEEEELEDDFYVDDFAGEEAVTNEAE